MIRKDNFVQHTFTDYNKFQIPQMNQSSTSVGLNLRSKGLRNNGGTLIKGCVKDATTKLSIGSIPSNYETIIYHSNSTKAFGTSQKRFYQESKFDLQKTDIPSESILTQNQPNKNPSHSTKGYGPFIAKQQRTWIQKKQAPGPGRYECTKSAETQVKRPKKRPCFSRQRKQNVNPVTTESKQVKQYPGPGQYYVFQRRNTNNGWQSSFKTKINRNAYLQNQNTPGPGYYDVKLIKQAKCVIKDSHSKQIDRTTPPKHLNFLSPQPNEQVPGPGSYQYEMPTFKPLYERIKISGNFMMSKKDRFNNDVDKFVIDEEPENTPNVYSYPTKPAFDDQKRLIKWPCFMSESKRMVFSGQKKLGPSFITPKLQNRRNFHFNIKGGWF